MKKFLLFLLVQLTFNLSAQPPQLKELNKDSGFFRKRKIELLTYSCAWENHRQITRHHFDHRGRIREYYGFLKDSAAESEKQVYIRFDEKGNMNYYLAMNISPGFSVVDTTVSEYFIRGTEQFCSRITTPIGSWYNPYESGYQYEHFAGDSFSYQLEVTFPESDFQYWELGYDYCTDSSQVKTDSAFTNRSDCENYTLNKVEKAGAFSILSTLEEQYSHCYHPEQRYREGFYSTSFLRTARNYRFSASCKEKICRYTVPVNNPESPGYPFFASFFYDSPFAWQNRKAFPGTSIQKETQHFAWIGNGKLVEPVLGFDCPLQKWLASSWARNADEF